MWMTTFASLRGHKRRTLATCSAVLLGVAFLAGTLVLGDTLRAGFGGLFEEANAGTDAMVRSSDRLRVGGFIDAGAVDADLVAQIAAVDGVAATAPFVEGDGQIIGADGETIGGDGPPTVAGNWVTEESLNPYRLRDGHAPTASDEVVIDARSARLGDLDVGDRTIVRAPSPVEVTVVGIAQFGSQDSMSGVTFAAFATERAQELLLAEPGQLSGVLVAAEEGLGQEELVERLVAMLPAGVEALSGAELTVEQNEEIEGDLLAFFETFLLVFAGVALVVATFSIYNTFSIVVAQRTRESALLRALGASRRQILGSVVAEAGVLGLLASAVGVIAGIGLSRGLSLWLDSWGVDLPTSQLVIERSSVVTALLVGVSVTLMASLAPAVKAARARPVAALRDVAVDRAAASRGRILIGLPVVAAGVGVTLWGAALSGDLALTGGGALLLVLGVVLCGPVAARPVSAVLGGPMQRLRGISGGLARANAMRNPTRTAGTASALTVGVAVVVMFTVLAASLKAYVRDVVEASFTGDLVVMADDFSGVGLSPELSDELARLPEVARVASLGLTLLQVDGRDTLADAVDGPELSALLDVGVTQGSLDGLVDGTLAVSEDYADRRDLAVGDSVSLGFADGAELEADVAALYEQVDAVGDVLIPREMWSPHARQDSVDVVFVGLAGGVSPEEGKAAVQMVVDRFAGPDVQDHREFVAGEADEIDEILAVVYVLLALAVLIGLMSIKNTLSLSLHERSRELGLLRAVGQSRRQLRSMVRGEALIVALFGTLIGLALGSFLGWALMRALVEQEGMAWAFAVPVSQLAVVTLLGGLAGLIAARAPARRAARLDILEAIATE